MGGGGERLRVRVANTRKSCVRVDGNIVLFFIFPFSFFLFGFLNNLLFYFFMRVLELLFFNFRFSSFSCSFLRLTDRQTSQRERKLPEKEEKKEKMKNM